MKYFSTILSIIALVSVGILFYLWKAQTHVLDRVERETRHGGGSSSSFKIGYFDLDTLEAHYDYFKDAQNAARADELAKNQELQQMELVHQKKIQEWRKRGNTMTQAELEDAQQQDNAMQRDYQARRDTFQQELLKKTEDMQTKIRKSIEEYVREYNKDRTYSFIFAYDPTTFIFYRDTLYNITSDLLTGLNAAYKKKN